jgi:hypothetical protein
MQMLTESGLAALEIAVSDHGDAAGTNIAIEQNQQKFRV